MKSNWLVSDPPDDATCKFFESSGIDKIIGSILYSRGITGKEELIAFLQPELNNFHSPFLMNGIPEAVARIRNALDKKEKVAIFADSDLDGITSLTILYDLLSKCGITPFIRYPQNKEGYGLTCDIIDEFTASGISLLITVDSGIRDIQEIRYAASKGIETIITDHHEPDDIYPDAIIINPKMPDCKYPYKNLAGVGVALKLAHALLFSFTAAYQKKFILIDSFNNTIVFHSIINGIITDRLITNINDCNTFITSIFSNENTIICTDAASEIINKVLDINNIKTKINTILNISNTITGMNYKNQHEMMNDTIKKFKLQRSYYDDEQLLIKLFLELQIRSSKKLIERMQLYTALAAVGTIADIMPLNGENRNIIKYGLEVFKNKKGHNGIQNLLNVAEPTAKNITWDIAPLLNTPGRFGETALTVDFFLNTDAEKTTLIIKEIEKLNRERKKIVASITEHIKEKIEAEPESCKYKLFYYFGNDIISGLAGLIASRIADELKKPVIVAVEETDAGMVKGSGRSYNDFNFFKFVEPLSEMFERIGGHAQAFGFTARKDRMPEIIDAINNAIDDIYEPDENITIDTFIDINEINSTLIDKLSQLEPFGKNNEEPVFIAKNIAIEAFSQFGSNGNHGKYILSNGLHVIGWNIRDKMQLYAQKKAHVDIIFNLENNIYMNRKYPRLKLIDIDFS
ncbi:MAG TPA: single-stranded-DNA-specific exonuclease RecJ [Spirochaetota bacterium]|nr:single-stranded-DNA-specific exonuclease RecJ [Spirochaetota bacterium]HPJ40782.1 single-stranded-DNA-specific exonuclease RecJ [Spirochaetota bacterium]HPR36051.1 single-stranded-DNA-specific exonuclease RecJ [Spirochaetota bacterium]